MVNCIVKVLFCGREKKNLQTKIYERRKVHCPIKIDFCELWTYWMRCLQSDFCCSMINIAIILQSSKYNIPNAHKNKEREEGLTKIKRRRRCIKIYTSYSPLRSIDYSTRKIWMPQKAMEWIMVICRLKITMWIAIYGCHLHFWLKFTHVGLEFA